MLAGCTVAAFGGWSSQDIGAVGAAGNFTYNATTRIYSVSGAGVGLDGAADAFQFVNQSVTGDIEITVRVDSISNNSPYTQAGICVRNSLDPNAIDAALYVSAQDGVNFTIRYATGERTTKYLGLSTQAAPVWLRLVKVGDTVAGYVSSDGLSWSLVAEDDLLLADTYYVGMPVASAIGGTLAQAQFSNVSLATNYPANMGGIVAWLRADQGVAQSSGKVSAWYDMSGYSHDAMQGNSTKQPSIVTNLANLNGKPLIRFNGSGEFMSIADSDLLDPSQFTLVVIGSYSGSTGNKALVSKSNWSTGYGIYADNTLGSVFGFTNGTTHKQGNVVEADRYALFLAKHDLQTLSCFMSSLERSGPYAVAQGATTFPLNIATDSSMTSTTPCDIAEVILFNRALNAFETEDIKAYAASKYGDILYLSGLLSAPTLAATSPLSSIYSASQIVTLNEIPGAILRYTLDGSEPTETSASYSGSITVNATATVKVRAFKTGYPPSATTTLSYTIDSSVGAFSHDGLSLWLRADQASVNGNGTLSWLDISGNNNHGAQSLASRTPVVTSNGTLNGRPVVRFDGVDDIVVVPDSPLTNPASMTIFLVGKCTNSTGNRTFLAKSNSTMTNGYGLVYSVPSGNSTFGFINSYANKRAGGPLAPGSYGVVSMTYDLSQIQTSINGNATVLSYSTAINPDAWHLYLGSPGTTGGASPLSGDIAEVLMYNRALSDAERMDVEAYLYGRYGIAGTSPKVPAPTVAQLSAVPGLCTTSQNVTISLPSGVTANYTTNGTDPSSGTPYTGAPISITGTTTLKVRYYKPNYQPSDVLTATYTIRSDVPFDPTGLKLWLSADQGVTANGTAVSGWADQSSFGNNATQTASTNQPTLITGAINGKPAISFDGTNDFLSVADDATISPEKVSVFIVCSANSTVSNRQYVGKCNNMQTSGYGIVGYANDANGFINSSAAPQYGGSFPANTFGVLSLIYDPAKAADQIRMSIASGSGNGSQTTIYTGTKTAAISNDSSPLYIGSWGGTKYLNKCRIAEILVFDRAVSDQQRALVEGYLKEKYNVGPAIQLPPPDASNLSLPPGFYQSVQSVSITVPQGQTAYYTLDGTVPTVNSPAYAGIPIPINSTSTLQVAFFKNGYIMSNTFSATYNIGFGGGGAPPTTGLMLWLRSDLGVSQSNGRVLSWADQSGRNNHAAAEATYAKQPTWVTTGPSTINTLPVIHFDGKKNYLGIADKANLRPTNPAVYLVGRYSESKAAKKPFLLKTSTTAWNNGYGLYKAKNNIYGFVNNFNNKQGSGFSKDVPGYFGFSYNGTALTATLSGSNYGLLYDTPINNILNAPLLLAGDGLGNFLECDISEVLLFDHTLSDPEMQKLKSYFYLRYSLGSLPKLPAPQLGNLSLAPGAYTSAQGVSITVPVGQQAYYTTDGTTEPSSGSTLYTSGAIIPIDRTTTLKVRFFQAGYAPSDTLTVPYTIGDIPPFPNFGLQMWLCGDKGLSLNGTSVSQWVDQSGNGNNAVAPMANQPVAATSGNVSVVRFNGTNSTLSVPDTASLNPSQLTMFVVANYQAGSGNRAFVVKANSGLTTGYGIYNSGGNAFGFVNNYSSGKCGGAFGQNGLGLLSFAYDPAKSSSQLTSSIALAGNGTAQPSVYTGNYTTPINNDVAPIYIGSWNGTALKNQCDIAEVALFNRALSDDEMAQMRAYFYARYSIGSLPSVPAPTLPNSQIFSDSFAVTMKSVSVGTIRYTTDGTVPTTSSLTYNSTSPPVLTATTTITAKGFVDGWGDGAVTTRTYTKDAPIPAGPVLRLRADVGVTTSSNSSNVTSWADQSGNGLFARQDDSARQPTLTTSSQLGGKPVIHFTRSRATWMAVGDSPGLNAGAITVCLVGMQTGSNATQGGAQSIFFTKADYSLSNGYGFMREGAGDTFGFFINNRSTAANKAMGDLIAGKYFTALLGYDNYRISFLREGVPMGQQLSSAAINNVSNSLYLGGRDTNQAYNVDGDIVELIVYNRALTLAEQGQLQSYLNTKYALNAPSSLLPEGAPALPTGGAPTTGADANSTVAPTITITYPDNAVPVP